MSRNQAKTSEPRFTWDEFEGVRQGLVAIEDAEVVLLRKAFGRVLAEDLIAPRNVPDADRATSDGYAVWLADLSFDTPSTLSVVGGSLVGHPFTGTHGENCAVRIATDALVPEGADAVVSVRDCRVLRGGEAVELPQTLAGKLRAGTNVRRRGADIRAGDLIVRKGQRLRPQDVALIAAQGLTRTRVRRRLRVGICIVSNGIAKSGSGVVLAQEYDSALVASIGLLQQLSCEVTDFGSLTDSPVTLGDLIAKVKTTHDVLIVCCGRSTEAIGSTRAALEAAGGEHLAQASTRPVTLGRIGNSTVVGVGGHGASVLVSLILFIRPLLLHRMGAQDKTVVHLPVRAGFELSRRAGKRDWLYARLEEEPNSGPVARVFRTGSSEILASMIAADGLVELPDDCSQVSRGDCLNYLPLDLLIAA